MISRSSLLIIVAIILVILLDQLYLKDRRELSSTQTVSEAFLRKGTLSDLLTNAGFLSVSKETVGLATQDLCAGNETLKGFDFHNSFRMRFKFLGQPNELNRVSVKLDIPQAKYLRHRSYSEIFTVSPGKHFYTLKFFARRGHKINITVQTLSKAPVVLSDVIIDGRFNRVDKLLANGTVLQGEIVNSAKVDLAPIESTRFDKNDPLAEITDTPDILKISHPVKGLALNGVGAIVELRLETGLRPKLYQGVFPGKKNQGFCDYGVSQAIPLDDTQPDKGLPRVNLYVDDEDLQGDEGILSNKQEKGKVWEVPAQYSVSENNQTYYQTVGLRFHGGSPGRKKDIASFRIYARKDYGKSTLEAAPLFGKPRAKDIKSLVFKYTYQAYFDQLRNNFNPFNHAFALDIADKVGALVPSHGLVDLYINDESQGMFLAMEHLSDRTIRHWLDHDDFVTYTYKKYNPIHIRDSFFTFIGLITAAQGEATLATLKERYNVDNVINSIILTSYVADDDYCQGSEILSNVKDISKAKITTVNWDLDHAFLKYKDNSLTITAQREAYALLSSTRNDPCPRRWAYSWVYAQSEEFRNLFRARLEQLLATELSPESLNRILDRYREINESYFNGEHSQAISLLEKYTRERPQILLDELDNLERSIADSKPDK